MNPKMTPTQYADRLVKDNMPTMEYYIESSAFLSEYLALWGAVASCKLQVDRKNQLKKEYVYYLKTLKILQRKFIKYCVLNTELLRDINN